MITIEQIKAARGLLDWTQGDLAKATGLSLPALNNIERKTVAPRVATLSLIEQALNRAGIEFTDGPGVRMAGEVFEYHKFEGKDFINDHTQDIIRHTGKGSLIYVCSPDDRKIMQHSKDSDAAYQLHVRTHKIDERILAPEGETYLISRPQIYRWLPQSAMGPLQWTVYDDRIAFYLWKKPYRAVTIHNPSLAEAYRKQFLFLWSNAKPVRKDGI